MTTYAHRAEIAENPTAKTLLRIIAEKKTNLALSADTTSKKKLLELADRLGPEICMFKTHIDIVEDFDIDLTQQLRTLADKHNFLIFEDRKFADIGNTVKLQYAKGVHHIVDWSDIVNAHIVPGPGIISGLKEVGLPKGRGLVLLAQMSSKDTMATGDYTQRAVELAEENTDFVMGFICVNKLSDHPNFIHMTPGVKLRTGTDAHGQQYLTPDEVIRNRGSDIIIVGRGIYEAEDPVAEAKKYREAAWDAYERRLT